MAVTSSGRRRQFIQLKNPVGDPIPNGDGEYLQDYEVFAEHFASVDPATAQKLERFATSAPISSATHIVVIPYEAGVTTATQVFLGSRQLNVVGYADPEERHIELVMICQELKP